MIVSVVSKTKNSKEINFKCDSCSIEFKKNYKKILIEQDYHFCSINCVNKEKKDGGLISSKIKSTNVKKYGVENVFQADDIKNKIKLTNLENFNVTNCSQSEEIKLLKKKTCFTNFGSYVPLQSTEIMKKYKTTLLDKYGVENVMQVPYIFNKAQENMKGANSIGYVKFSNNKIFYRSSYEKQFLEQMLNKDIIIESNFPIEYFFENKVRKYFIDFLIIIANKKYLVEIKPESLLNTAQNIEKFKAAKEFIKTSDIDNFIIVTEKQLNSNVLNIFYEE